MPRPTPRPATVVLAAAALAAVVVVHRGHAFAAVAGLLVEIASAAAFVDRHERRIPNRLVMVGLAAVVVADAVVAAVDHRHGLAVSAVVGAACYAGPLLALHLASPGGIGFGDVKLGAVLGLGLGVAHPVLGALALLTACVAAVARRAAVRRWRTPEPFAPAMAAGVVVALLVARPMVEALGFGWW